jgi:hypothetical protein
MLRAPGTATLSSAACRRAIMATAPAYDDDVGAGTTWGAPPVHATESAIGSTNDRAPDTSVDEQCADALRVMFPSSLAAIASTRSASRNIAGSATWPLSTGVRAPLATRAARFAYVLSDLSACGFGPVGRWGVVAVCDLAV